MEIKSNKLYTRGGIIYIDANIQDIGRIRFSTKLKHTQENLAKALVNIQDYIYGFLRYETEEHKLKKPNFENVAKRFLQDKCSHLKAQTLLKYESNINDLIQFFGNKDLRLIPQSYLNTYAKQTTQAYKITFLNRIISYAKDEGYITHLKPLSSIRLSPQATAEPINPLSLQEVQQCLQKATGELKLFLTLAFFTGMRTGELLALQYKDLDFINEKIQVNKSREIRGDITTTKTHKARYIDMLEIVKNTFLPLYQQSKAKDFIFSTSLIHLRKQWYALLESLNLAKRTIYQTRHTFATIMLTHNEEVLWISAMLGHKSLSTTFDHYVKYIPSQKKRATFLQDYNFTGGQQ